MKWLEIVDLPNELLIANLLPFTPDICFSFKISHSLLKLAIITL